MNDSTSWREAWAASATSVPNNGHDCLEADELLAALDGTLTGERHERAISALAECASCAAIAQIALDLRGTVATAEFVPQSDGAGRVPLTTGATQQVPRRSQHVWAAAAALVVAVGIGGMLRHWQLDAPIVVRSGMRADQTTPASGSTLSAAPQQLEWMPVSAASGYRVELYNDHADLLWQSTIVVATRLDLPAEVRARLGTGTWLWRVRAQGNPVEVGPYYFSIAP